MSLTVELKLSIDDVVTLRECVDVALKIQRFNAGAVAATKQEKLDAGRAVLNLERLQRMLT